MQKLQLYVTDQALRARLLRELPERFPALAVTSSLPVNIELNQARANKGEALRRLCALLGIDPAETVAFGDGANDLPMLNLAGLGIAYHAKPKVKQNAQQSISSIGIDGVLYMLGFKDSYIQQ